MLFSVDAVEVDIDDSRLLDERKDVLLLMLLNLVDLFNYFLSAARSLNSKIEFPAFTFLDGAMDVACFFSSNFVDGGRLEKFEDVI